MTIGRYAGLRLRWPKRTGVERFMSHVSPEPNTGCWIWTGAIDSRTGYAIFAPSGAHAARASHFAFALRFGRRPSKGLDCCHTCDHRFCVSPDHLFEGTRSDNMRDAARKGRVVIGNAKLTLAQAAEIRCRAAAGERTKDLAREFGVAAPTISNVKKYGRKIGYTLKEV